MAVDSARNRSAEGPEPPRARRRAHSRGGVARRFVRHHRWWLVLLLAAASMVLGVIGYTAAIPNVPFGDRLYDTVNLFRLGGTASLSPPLPPALEAARWLAPLTLAFAGFWAVNSVLAEQFTLVRIRWRFRKHLIVCGLGTFGRLMAEGFDARGDQVVVVERDPAGYNVAWCRSAGIPIVHGDATDSRVLERAGLARARRVIAVCGEDSVNAEVAVHVRHRRVAGRDPLDCYVQLEDPDLCSLLEEQARGLDSSGLTIHFLNVNRAGPLALLESYSGVLGAADNVVRAADTLQRPPRMIVVGSEPLSLSLTVGAARQWWFDKFAVPHLDRADPHTTKKAAGRTRRERSHTRIEITLVAPDAEERIEQLFTRYPRLTESCELTACAMDLAAYDSPVPPMLGDVSSDTGTAFVCLAEESACLAAALRLRRALPESFTIVACILGRSGSMSGIDVVSQQLSLRGVSTFPLVQRVCDPEFVLNDLTETIARSLHANYLGNRRRDGSYDPAHVDSHRDWDELPEMFREANRAQARCVTERLESVGCEIRPTEDWDVATPMFSPDEVEAMAKIEHLRWCEDRLANGWTRGPRDDRARRHPDLVPWDQLEVDAKEKDREAVRELPSVLAREGLAITRASIRG